MTTIPFLALPLQRGLAAGAALALLAAGPALATEEFTQHGVHEHGKATLDVALDGGTLDVRLTTPAINVLGFERAPRTDAEKKAVADAAALLGGHRELFSFPVAARCTHVKSEVTAPEWAGGPAQDKGRDKGKAHDHDHDHDHDHGAGGHDHAHADYVARWTFTCAAPAALAFFDAPLLGRLQPGTEVAANVLSEAVQNRQDLAAGSVRVRVR